MKFKIGNKFIGDNEPCFIIAEVGINHNGDINIAKKLIDSAAEAGCDAVKFQAFKAERMYPKSAGELNWKDGKNEYSYDIYEANKSFELPDNWWLELRNYAKSKNLIFFSSVFDEQTIDRFEEYFDILKASSFSITHIPLLKHIAKKGKPIIFSTGTATIEEIGEAYNEIKTLNKNIMILHCVSEYPAPLEHTNIVTIEVLRERFPDAIIGFSDHSSEISDASTAAIVHGAKIIEKHITLNRRMEGPDHFFALEPEMLKQMVNTIRKTEQDLIDNKEVKVDSKLFGKRNRELSEKEKYIKSFCRGSVMTTRAIKKGEILTKKDIIVLRNGKKKPGLPPKWYDKILSNKYILINDVEVEHPLQESDIKKVKSKVVAVVQARVGSTRLKEKVLMKIRGKTILEWVIYRLKKSKKIDNIIIATSTNKENDKIEKLSKKLEIDCFRGSEDDVLGRIFNTANKFNADIVIRITADEPLIDPKIVDEVIENHIKNESEYTSTTINRTLPKGVDVEILDFNCLEKLDKIAKIKYDREHVTSYIHSHKNDFKINSFETKNKKLKRKYVLTVDNIDDFNFVKEIFNHFKKDIFYTEDIINFIDKRIAIRVDGSNKGGLGHIYRCLVLAKELKKQGFYVSFIMYDIDNVPKKVEKEMFEVIKIKGLDEEQRSKELIKILNVKRVGILIADLIEINYDFSDKIRRLGTRIICLDILGKIKLRPDIIINGTIIKERYNNYDFNSGIKYYLGPKYEILNKNFEKTHKIKRRINKNIKNVLVTLGGSDPKNLCPKVIEALDSLNLNVYVIHGHSYNNIKQIKNAIKKTKGNFSIFYDVENIEKFMIKSDIAITAGGRTLYELATTGTPAIICCEVPHQVDNANAFEKEGSVINLGLLPSKNKIRERFIELSKNYKKREFMSKIGKKIVDGNGLKRVMEVIKQI